MRTQPTRIIQGLWEAGDLFFLRKALLKIVNGWKYLSIEPGPCPVSFDKQEIALNLHEKENRSYIDEVLTFLRNNSGLYSNSSIESSRLNEMQVRLIQTRHAFIEGADNNEDKMLAEKLWPY